MDGWNFKKCIISATLPIMVKNGPCLVRQNKNPPGLHVALRKRNQKQEDNDWGRSRVPNILVYNGTSVGHSKSSRYHPEVHIVTTL